MAVVIGKVSRFAVRTLHVPSGFYLKSMVLKKNSLNMS